VYANSKALIQNFGYETILKAKLIDKRKFSWSESFNFGWNRNKLIAYPDLAQSPYAATFTIGESLNIVRLLHYTNVDPQTGQYSFTDKNHDGVIENYWNNGNNDFYNKDLSVKYEGGLTSDFRYSRFQLSFFFVFRSQLAVSEIFTGALPGEIGNQSTKILNHWVKPGDNAPFARLTTGQLATNTDFDFFTVSDGVYSNGAYIRLKNLSLAYDVPLNPSAKKSVQGIRIFVRGENLFLFTKYNGLDPQTPSLNALPFQTIITFGAQINL